MMVVMNGVQFHVSSRITVSSGSSERKFGAANGVPVFIMNGMMPIRCLA